MDEFRWSIFTQLKKDYDEVELLEGYIFEDTSTGIKYRNIRWHPETKTLCYEMFHKTSDGKIRWEGVFHGRLMRDFEKMEKTKQG